MTPAIAHPATPSFPGLPAIHQPRLGVPNSPHLGSQLDPELNPDLNSGSNSGPNSSLDDPRPGASVPGTGLRPGSSPLPKARLAQAILMITAIATAESCAATLSSTLGVPVQISLTRKLGLAQLRRQDYAMVIVDESIVDADPAGADLLWKHSGLAIPLQVNFALLGCARLGREVKAALARREQEQTLAMRAATSILENDLKSTVTGLLLHSELALAEPSVPPRLAGKLKLMVELAGTLRRRLEQSHP